MYSPKINERQVRKLYFLKVSFALIGIRKPMTEMVNEALEKYIPEKINEIQKADGTIVMPDKIGQSEEES
ncbi:MAG: hypothetical protein WBB67_12120 [bacterium]